MSPKKVVLIVVGGFLLLCVFCSSSRAIFQRLTEKTVYGTVEDTYIKRYSEEDIFHVVIRDDDGIDHVFQNKDSAGYLKFNSADLQQELRRIGEENLRCEFQAYGWRVQITSGFPVVVEVKNCQPASLCERDASLLYNDPKCVQ